MKAAAKKRKSEAELFDFAINNLLRAIKQNMLEKHGRVNYAKLRKAGYSERLLLQLKQA